MVERGSTSVPLRTQARILSLNRSSLYYKPTEPSEEEVRLKHRIDRLYTDHPVYGSRRITQELRFEGWDVNRKRVQRCMREMGLAGICPGPHLSKRNLRHKVYPYLLRNVTPSRPNHVWGIDITYINLKHGWMYLVAVIDWYSRYIVSWQLSQTLEMPFVLETVKSALRQATPEIMNSASPATSTRNCSRTPACGSAWTARTEHSTTSSQNASGARSSTRKST